MSETTLEKPEPAVEAGVNKMDMVRQILGELGDKAATGDVKAKVRERFGVDISNKTVQKVRRERVGRQRAAPDPQRPRKSRREAHQPAIPSAARVTDPPEPIRPATPPPSSNGLAVDNLLRVRDLAHDLGGLSKLEEYVGVLRKAQV